jgi:hypothetical protein
MQTVEFESTVLDGKIEVPYEYREEFSTVVKVILMKTETNTAMSTGRTVNLEKRRAAIRRLDGCLKGCTMTLEDARAERLSKK